MHISWLDVADTIYNGNSNVYFMNKLANKRINAEIIIMKYTQLFVKKNVKLTKAIPILLVADTNIT